RVPGVHVEGPYLNPECLGAQNPAWARLPDLDEMRRVCETGEVMIVSLAAELEGAAEVIEWLSHQGIIPSLAHSAATFHEVMSAKESGLRHFTHLCNQMTGVHHREIGAVGAGLLDADLRMEVIPDGIHLCPEMLALLFRLVDRERIMVITDSISASGLSDGTYEEGGQEVLVRDGICRLPSGALAGSTLAYPKAISVLEEAIGEPFAQFVETTSWNQARSCGWTDVGKIEQGFRADFALLDPSDHRVIRTIVAGKEVYKAF
ncbi:MAG: amidohydrolase family protein, partial [Verrucomicrobiota bacterium]